MDGKQNIISDLFTGSEGNMPYEKTVRLIIYSIIAIALIILFVVGIKWLKRKIKGDELLKEVSKDIKRSNLTLSNAQFEQIAASIFEAAHGVGTDEDTIYRNLNRLQTKDDWYKLISVYGTDKDNFNLVARLIYELDDSEKEKINQILSKFGETI